MQTSYMRMMIIGLMSAFLAVGALACKSGPDDTAISANVQQKLKADSVTKNATVSVMSKDGAVTLTGAVDSDAVKSRAETVAKTADGVKSVKNDLTVKPMATTTPTMPAASANDTAIMNAVKAKLDAGGMKDVTVDVKDGVVTLTGTVPKGSMTKAVMAANEANPKPSKVNNQLTEK